MQSKKRKPKGYWNKERCIDDAKNYRYKKEWEKKSKSAFTIAHRNKWLDECCTHMMKIGNAFHRAIYAIEFSDKSVYIGLTHDLDERIADHFRNPKSTVYKYIHQTNLKPTVKLLTNYLDKDSAILFEEKFLIDYKLNHYKILNIAKTGALGGTKVIWSKERCIEEALNFSSKIEWHDNSPTSYKKASKMKWLNECTGHMKRPISKKMKWTFEICKEIASTCNSKWEWIKKSKNSYNAAYSQGWIEDCTKHME